ncbi:bifunctional diaminohydroxyphosphoribosylaminopyrimidine deaminase/5-amino-6-(5-phosphoribosylamino)uracil reductase RibD [Steroidobacter agaridevorans]|uniref:bifunctional diaminohydroxyphosphoribosylaminopyrimidine deaminase/5-amino-6-(5-phosphoribosylamino)uracil reductase RibD n=1 Tax=Steroidobacter agaridevorans TaxID=2695856 RepID=UPI00192A31C1|nr:bifunctional diaminohydroxyphosphoribosylaminopyrimidine deaminase/5-amino-6-(5-phosphoribosylamino)uracil reductase RibD [Steroidobacter agaridevorans]
MFSSFDERTMQRAIELAALGRHTTPPNPSVGCIVTQGERIVGEGWHRKWGEPHAEPLALQAAGAETKGATVYVTLEPHSYQGRTPPCTDALIGAGVRRVVIGVLDANPKVSGDGVRQLQAAGIEVQVGLLADAARELNLGFEKRMITGRPRLIVKSAISLDGGIALANGQSKWITGTAARADVQRLRSRMSAVMTGIETVLADDPQLNVRDPSIDMLGRQPLRVVLDSKLRMPATAAMLKLTGETLIFSGAPLSDVSASVAGKAGSRPANAASVAHELRQAGAEIVAAELDADGRIDLDFVLAELGRRMCNDVLVEAGPTLVGRILQLGLADEIIAYVAPVLLGPDARAMADLPALQTLEQAQRYTMHSVDRVGDDVRLTLRRRPEAP